MAPNNMTISNASALTGFQTFPEINYDCRYSIWQAIIMLLKMVEVKEVETGKAYKTAAGMEGTEVKLELVSMHTFPTMYVNRESRSVTQKYLQTWMKAKTDFTFHVTNPDILFRPQDLDHSPSNANPWPAWPVFRFVDTVTSISFDIQTVFKTWKGHGDDMHNSWKHQVEGFTASLKRLRNLRELILVIPSEFNQTIVVRTFKETALPLFMPKTTSEAYKSVLEEWQRIGDQWQGNDINSLGFQPARIAYNDGCDVKREMGKLADRSDKSLGFSIKLQCWNFEDWNTNTPKDVKDSGRNRTRRVVQNLESPYKQLLGTEVVDVENRVFERLCWKPVAERGRFMEEIEYDWEFMTE